MDDRRPCPRSSFRHHRRGASTITLLVPGRGLVISACPSCSLRRYAIRSCLRLSRQALSARLRSPNDRPSTFGFGISLPGSTDKIMTTGSSGDPLAKICRASLFRAITSEPTCSYGQIKIMIPTPISREQEKSKHGLKPQHAPVFDQSRNRRIVRYRSSSRIWSNASA